MPPPNAQHLPRVRAPNISDVRSSTGKKQNPAHFYFGLGIYLLGLVKGITGDVWFKSRRELWSPG